MKFRIILFSAFIILTAFSCKTTKDARKSKVKSNMEPTKLDSKNPIIGNWIWVETVCCGRMKGITKAAESKETKGLNVYTDGKYELLTNGKVSTTGTYKMGTGTPYKERESIQMDDNSGALITFVDDKLILSWEYMDLQIETYQRVKANN